MFFFYEYCFAAIANAIEYQQYVNSSIRYNEHIYLNNRFLWNIENLLVLTRIVHICRGHPTVYL